MPRLNTTAELLAALQRAHVTHFFMLELELDSGPQRLSTTPFDVTWNANAYRGIAGIGSIEAVSETSRGATGLKFTLPLVSQAAIASALTERMQGRRATLRYAVVDDSDPASPVLRVDPVVWRGKLDHPQLTGIYSPRPLLTVTAEHELIAWDRATNTPASHEEHQRWHPGDNIYRYAAETAGKRIVWPARSWYQR